MSLLALLSEEADDVLSELSDVLSPEELEDDALSSDELPVESVSVLPVESFPSELLSVVPPADPELVESVSDVLVLSEVDSLVDVPDEEDELLSSLSSVLSEDESDDDDVEVVSASDSVSIDVADEDDTTSSAYTAAG